MLLYHSTFMASHTKKSFSVDSDILSEFLAVIRIQKGKQSRTINLLMQSYVDKFKSTPANKRHIVKGKVQ